MSSPVNVADGNQFSALASSPTTAESKSWEGTARSMKDDAKQQAFQAREGVKAKAAGIKEQVVGSTLYDQVSSQLGKGIELAKSKVAGMTGDSSIKSASNEELLEKASDAAAGEWETVKSRGNKAVKQAERQLDENLTPQQKAQLNKATRGAKQAGARAQRKVDGVLGQLLSAPQLRGVRTFIERNNLQLPVMILGTILTLWLSLSLIRIITTAATPRVPEFDIHSKENSMNWLKWHAGEYKNRAVDAKDSLSARAANFLANYELEKLQAQAVDWKDIGMKKLGLAEPTWSESAWAWMTGRPLTWQGRVESVLDLTKQGLKATALKQGLSTGYNTLKGNVKEGLGIHEPTLLERATNWATGRDTTLQGRINEQATLLNDRVSGGMDRVNGGIGGVVDSIRANIPGMHSAPVAEAEGVVDGLKHRIVDGVNTVRAHLPGGADAAAKIEAARLAAYNAAHPHSTLDNIKSGAEYIKNRVIHGSEEAAHIAQDKAKRAMDEAKYKTGL